MNALSITDTASSLPAVMPLTMSSLEIAGLTGKRHLHILRDVRKMLVELGVGETSFGSTYLDSQGKGHPVFNLPRRECLILVSGYSVQMRAAIIDRWQQLEAALVGPAVTQLPADVAEYIRRTDGISRMLAHKVTGLESAIALIAGLVQPHQPVIVRRGKTAGQIWRDLKLPKLKGVCTWFGNRLGQMGCQIEGRGELGLTTARLFDPDKAATWLDNGGMHIVQQKIAERQGQGKLRLVGETV